MENRSSIARALMPDYLRLAALFGIVVVNVQFIAFPVETGFAGASTLGAFGPLTAWLVDGLATMKSFGLFSFMFGVGLAFQIQSAARRGLAFGALYRNRMFGLILLGLAHGALFFSGDILVAYGLLGGLLYLWGNWTVLRLTRMGIGLLIVQILVALLVSLVPTEMDPIVAQLEQEVQSAGGGIDVVVFRTISFGFAFLYIMITQGLAALGWFCLGLAAVNAGWIDRADHPGWVALRRWCLLPGVALSLLGSWAFWMQGDDWGELLVLVAAPIATAEYLGLIAWISRPPSRVVSILLMAGASSLTIYLGQSILLSTIFAPYALGLWNAVTPAQAVLIAVAVTFALIAFVMLWRQAFRMGPFEMVLRWVTRLGQRGPQS